MLFKRIYDEDLAQASYFIACQQAEAAVVVDPRRDIGVYLEEARAAGVHIAAVTETHIHADYLSGARELAARAGATLYLSNEGGDDWQYRFPHEPLHDGSEIRLGNVTLRALHTPGHTPEHLSFLVIDGTVSDQPNTLLSGDFVFVGDVGRPDLLDEVAAGDTRLPMARRLYKSLKEKFLALPDYVQLWPGHGAGSACGKALGAAPSSTVGYERRFSWWAGQLELGDEDGFVATLLTGQPDAPGYFARMKRQNRDGPALLGARGELEHISPEALPHRLEAGARLLDARAKEAFLAGHVPGSLHVPAGKNFAPWAVWVIDPERNEGPLILLAADADAATLLRDELARVGIDRITGYLTSLDGLELIAAPTVTAGELDYSSFPVILDVRNASEYDAGHFPNAVNIPGGQALWRLHSLPQGRPLLLHCQSGARSAVVGSALRAAGVDSVELEGGYGAWLLSAAKEAEE
jgi:hydroxyacylglutathione hydrolase